MFSYIFKETTCNFKAVPDCLPWVQSPESCLDSTWAFYGGWTMAVNNRGRCPLVGGCTHLRGFLCNGASKRSTSHARRTLNRSSTSPTLHFHVQDCRITTHLKKASRLWFIEPPVWKHLQKLPHQSEPLIWKSEQNRKVIAIMSCPLFSVHSVIPCLLRCFLFWRKPEEKPKCFRNNATSAYLKQGKIMQRQFVAQAKLQTNTRHLQMSYSPWAVPAPPQQKDRNWLSPCYTYSYLGWFFFGACHQGQALSQAQIARCNSLQLQWKIARSSLWHVHLCASWIKFCVSRGVFGTSLSSYILEKAASRKLDKGPSLESWKMGLQLHHQLPPTKHQNFQVFQKCSLRLRSLPPCTRDDGATESTSTLQWTRRSDPLEIAPCCGAPWD